ncbi:SPC3-like protein [Mya arenaria]|uniref:SPC3-like protein n=1 Tax=Mya arenaria TaxID=6604 RepID=A0ABY7FAJ9_MYAAR|nr:SPC3-like protein [Mya arenaria]
MPLKYGPKLGNGVSFHLDVNRTPTKRNTRAKSKRIGRKMENSNEMKIPDDVDKESKPLDDGEKGSVYTLSLGFDADDVISASDMPNVVNENDNVSENISELIADIDKEIEDENLAVLERSTVLSGMCIFCCGKSRIPVKYDQDHVVILCTNTWVGVAQLFTVTFLFVGWFWSLAWGIKMIILSVQRRQELADQRAIELQTMALSAFGTLPKRGV